ncbi:MAG TPA: hypothetical protein VHZ09_06175 [Acidobacteriaceae bacterium]|jgi:hypothetical protein|nr:hypothetical protein [Acidobacteriaceae bacterium]
MDLFSPDKPRSIRSRAAGGVAAFLLLVPWLLVPFAVSAQQPALPSANPSALVRRAVDNYLAQEAAHRPVRFFFHKHDERRDFTQDIMETAQGDVALTVAANGQPLSPADHQLQIDRLNNLAAHPDLQAHRQKREQEDTARVDRMLRLLPDAFAWRDEGLVPCTVTVPPAFPVPGGSVSPPPNPSPVDQCYHLSFTPKPNWTPPDAESRIFRGMAGDLWIEESQNRLVRLAGHIISDVDFGWGIVGRLNKGGTIELEETEFPGKEWELTRMKLDLSGKILMVKAVTFRMTEEMTHFSPVPPNLDYRQAIRILESSEPMQPR